MIFPLWSTNKVYDWAPHPLKSDFVLSEIPDLDIQP
eukprot:UN17790